MKKLAVLLALLFTGLSLCFAQITITYSNIQSAFAVGSQYSSVGDTSHTLMNVGTASSTAQTWDFRGRPYYLQGTGVSIAPSSAPRISQFPTANVVTSSGVDSLIGYVYFSLQPSGLDMLGYSDSTSASFYTPPIPTLRLPCTMGTNWTYQSDTNWVFRPFVWILTSNTYRVDAHGTLRLPTGDYQALRLKNTQITFNGVLGTVSQSKSITYNFQTTSLNSATVSIDTAQDNLANVNPKYVTYSGLGTNDISPLTGTIPERFALDQNYPNPFNPNTVVSYQLPVVSDVRLVVYDILGREVAVLVNERKAPGSYSVMFNANGLASGVYLYKLTAGGFTETKKLALLK